MHYGWLLMGCLLLGCSSSEADDCSGHCEQAGVTGPEISLEPGSALIAAVESSAPCSVAWDYGPSRWACPGHAEPDCVDRIVCKTANDAGAIGCPRALVDIHADSCTITVIATTGERQSFEVHRSPNGRFTCRAGCGGPWIEMQTYSFEPYKVTLSFAPGDGGPGDADAGSAADAPLR
jgi:hypothetical protein